MPNSLTLAAWTVMLPIAALTMLAIAATLVALIASSERANRAHRVLRTLLGALQVLLRCNRNRDR